MSTECLIVRFGLKLQEAKNLLFLMPLLATAFIPVYSWIVQKKGRKTLCLVLGYLMALASYLVLALLPKVGDAKEQTSTKLLLLIPIILLSQFRAISATVCWSMVSLTSPSFCSSFAFGIALFFNNFSGMSFPKLLGYLIKGDNKKSFENGLYLMLLITALGFFLALLMVFVDLKKGGILWYPENSEKVQALKDSLDLQTLDRITRRSESELIIYFSF